MGENTLPLCLDTRAPNQKPNLIVLILYEKHLLGTKFSSPQDALPLGPVFLSQGLFNRLIPKRFSSQPYCYPV